MTQESPLTYSLIREKWGEKKKIFQRASPHYNVNNTLLTTVLQERTCTWARNIQEAKETNKTLPVSVQRHPNAKAGHTVQFRPRYEWVETESERKGQGKNGKALQGQVGSSSPRQLSFLDSSRIFLTKKHWVGGGEGAPIFIICFIYVIREHAKYAHSSMR